MCPGHLFTIGRLDADSEGLMVLTNDGELANSISHPRYEHTKTYKVTVKAKYRGNTVEAWESGIWLDDSRTAACSAVRAAIDQALDGLAPGHDRRSQASDQARRRDAWAIRSFASSGRISANSVWGRCAKAPGINSMRTKSAPC